jgi:dTDP-4-dehydrorhamnose reductase
MLGHTLWRVCRQHTETRVTVRAPSADLVGFPVEDIEAVIPDVRAEAPDSVERALDAARPEVAINCVGVVKQATAASDAVRLMRANALFPHELAASCQSRNIRLVHISTDCVFSGRRGGYRERDIPDPVDLYGRSKLAGEPCGTHVLTLRTSMIGWEVGGRRHGLLEWFVAQRGGAVRGYTRAVFSGPTAAALSRAVLAAIERRPHLSGTWHIAAEPIAKHDLLLALRAALGLDIEVAPDEGVVIDRSLDGSAFRDATGWRAPSWEEMVSELVGTAPAHALGAAIAGR